MKEMAKWFILLIIAGIVTEVAVEYAFRTVPMLTGSPSTSCQKEQNILVI